MRRANRAGTHLPLLLCGLAISSVPCAVFAGLLSDELAFLGVAHILAIAIPVSTSLAVGFVQVRAILATLR